MTGSFSNEVVRRLSRLLAWRKHGVDALRRLDEAIMPLRCVFCGARLHPGEQRICRGCRRDLPWVRLACEQCAAPVEVELPAGVHCASCQARRSPLQMTVAPLRYEFPVDAGLKALKFGRRLYYAPAFAGLLVSQFPRFPPGIDALLPVPLHWRRQAFRGFNQAMELLVPLSRHLGLEIVTGVSRVRATAFQSGLSASQRRRNLRNVFVVRTPLKHRHVLVVDDVVTTGETTRQLARALIARGAERVSVLAVARAA